MIKERKREEVWGGGRERKGVRKGKEEEMGQQGEFLAYMCVNNLIMYG